MANQPKRYKKFVATAATATLVASAIAPVASASFKDVADNNDHKKNIEAIAELGYMGAGDNFRPSENVTRGQVAIILANWAQDVAGLEVPADYKDVQRFKDVPLTADDKLLQSAALVKEYGIFEGSNGNLNGASPISREHMALVLNKAYEAVTGTSLVELAGDTSDVTFADEASINKDYLHVVKALKKLGITAPASFNPKGSVTRGQFASFFVQTVNAEEPVDETELKVESVSAINAKQIQVTFNQEVDKTSARNLANYFTQNATNAKANVQTTDATANVSISDDGKTVTITATTNVEALARVTQAGTPFTFEVNGVKSVNGEEFPKLSTELKVDDKVAPKLVTAEAKASSNTKTVTLTFTEPVDPSTGVYKVNGKVASVAAGSTPNTLTVTSVDSLEAGKSYSLEILNAKDYADNIILPVNTTVTVVKDASAANITSVTTLSDNKIRVTFDKSMNTATLAPANITVINNNGTTVLPANYGVTPVSNTSNKTFDITFTGGLYTGVDSEALTLVFNNNIKDSVGNAISTVTKTATLNKDVVAPKVQSVKVLPKNDKYDDVTYTNGALILTFNEDVVDPGATVLAGSSVTIVDQDGTDISGLVTLGDPVLDSRNDNVLVVPFSANTITSTSKTATIRVSAGITTDATLGANKNEAATFNNVNLNESIKDTDKPVVAAVTGVPASNTITFTVTEANLDKSSVQNVDNYRLDGKPLAPGSYVTIAGTAPNFTATVHLAEGSVEKTRANYAFTISGIKDNSGNVADTVGVNNVSLTDDVEPVLEASKVNSDNTFTLTFSEAITNAVAADFEIYVNNKVVALPVASYALTPVTVGSDAGSVLVNLVLSYEDTDTTASSGDEKLYLDVDGVAGYNAATDILLLEGSFANKAAAETAYGYSVVDLSSLTSIKVKTASSTTGADAATNTIKSGTLITVK